MQLYGKPNATHKSYKKYKKFRILSVQLAKTFLTLIGIRYDIFMALFFLEQILSAEFLSKVSKLFWRWKLTSIELI